MNGRILIVAGSDSGGGAGIQADIKSVTALGGFAATAITALTAQNTLGVHDVFPVDIAFIQQQMRVVLGDIGADSLKTGMLHSPEVIEAVCAVLDSDAAGIPVVVDPVMVAKGGASLLADEAVATLRDRLLPRAHVITPNIPEAETLLGEQFFDVRNFPKMTFESTSIKRTGEDTGIIEGELTLHGYTKTVRFDAKFRGTAKSPFSGKSIMAITAVAEVDQTKWGLTAWRPFVGNTVTIRIGFEASPE